MERSLVAANGAKFATKGAKKRGRFGLVVARGVAAVHKIKSGIGGR